MEEEKNTPVKGEENPWTLYIIINVDLGMTAGKIAAQTGHAIDIMRDEIDEIKSRAIRYQKTDKLILSKKQIESFDLDLQRYNNYLCWKQAHRRKIVLQAHQKEFEKLLNYGEVFKYFVTDAGLTQVKPGSVTIIGLLPMRKNNAPKLVRRLRNLE
jgi:peptidyl-tRNA hydrolase